MKAAVYRNLHKSCWSVRNRSTGRVEAHADSIMVHDCTFRVGKAGRERVIREGRKNVHAGVYGTVDGELEAAGFRKTSGWARVTYNPYRNETFVDEKGNPVFSASCVALLSDGKVYAKNINKT